jgi:uncharacterized protein
MKRLISKMKILITGATGLIGGNLCRLLINKGHEVVALSRRPPAAAAPPVMDVDLAEIIMFQWEPLAGPPPEAAWEGVDAVIHLAGEPVMTRWTEEQKRRIRNSRVKVTQNLLAGIRAASRPPKVFVSTSAVGFYGDRGDEILNESSAPGAGFLSELCIDWEDEAARARELGVRVPLVRVGVVLSPSGGALEKMSLPFKMGLGGRVGAGRQWFPWIHIEDIAGIFLHALSSPAVDGPINGVAPGVVTNGEFTREFAAALNRPAFFTVPKFALRILMGEMSEVVTGSQRIVPQVALDTGYQFKYPNLRPALESILKSRK